LFFCLTGYTSRMLKEQAIKLAGSQAKLANLLGITRGAVWLWGEDVPIMRIYQLKVLKPQWFKDEKQSESKSLRRSPKAR
jgi:hypothetical protein